MCNIEPSINLVLFFHFSNWLVTFGVKYIYFVYEELFSVKILFSNFWTISKFIIILLTQCGSFQTKFYTKLNDSPHNFQVILDVQQFTPNEITVKTTEKHIVVEGKHEEKADEHGYISRHFVRRYQLPRKWFRCQSENSLLILNFRLAGTNPNDISSTLSSDGVLTVTAPLKPAIPQNSERFVPITQTGPTKTDSNQPKVELS